MSLYSSHDLLDELQKSGATVYSVNRILCPFHDDQNPSAGIFHNGDNHWRFKCQACGVHGDRFDLEARRTGTPLSEILPKKPKRLLEGPKSAKSQSGKFATMADLRHSLGGWCAKNGNALETLYIYSQADETPYAVIARIKTADGGKTFRQFRWTGGAYEPGGPPKPWVLYNLPKIAAADFVIVTEGEKAADAINANPGRVIATTAIGGAGRAESVDWSPLAGKKVWLWPDNDDAGRDHMRSVEVCLMRLDKPPTINWIDIDGLQMADKGDAADWLGLIKSDGDISISEAIESLLDESDEDHGPGYELLRDTEQIITGQKNCIDWPFHVLTTMTNALMPDSITMICGSPGSSKSLLIIQCLRYWIEKGVKACAYMLEDSRTYHLRRVLAQEKTCAGLTDYKWIKDHHGKAYDLSASNRDYLDKIGAHIIDISEEVPQLSELVAWVKGRIDEGYRIICIDPITSAKVSKARYVDDEKFIAGIRSVMRGTGASLILITHTSKGIADGTIPGLDDLAGGAAWSRFTSNVFILKQYESNDPVDMLTSHALQQSQIINRTIYIAKARNGKGSGLTIGYKFNVENLSFEEYGCLVQERRRIKY